MEIGSTFLLDTSAYSALNRGDARLLRYFNTRNTLLVPCIVIGELRAGFAAGSKISQNEGLLSRFLDAGNVQIVPITLATTEKYAAIFARLRKSGTPIGTNDLWIAAMAAEHNMPLLTLDSDFKKVKGLKLLPL